MTYLYYKIYRDAINVLLRALSYRSAHWASDNPSPKPTARVPNLHIPRIVALSIRFEYSIMIPLTCTQLC